MIDNYQNYQIDQSMHGTDQRRLPIHEWVIATDPVITAYNSAGVITDFASIKGSDTVVINPVDASVEV